MDTPIYDKLTEQYSKESMIWGSSETFLALTDVFPADDFDIDDDQVVRLRNGLMNALVVSMANAQRGIYDRYPRNEVEIFNEGTWFSVSMVWKILKGLESQ